MFFVALLALWPALGRGEAGEPHLAGQASAHALELRLVAPCCWNQTLDVHESEVAAVLRQEIRARLANGETSAVIEDDFARRYGERIRAVPRGRDPLLAVPLLIGALMTLSALGLIALGRRWTRQGLAPPTIETRTTLADDYDGRLDEELQRL